MKGEHHCSAGKQQRSDDKHESEEAHAHTAGNTQDRQEEPEEDEDGNQESSPSTGRDYTKFSINGVGNYAFGSYSIFNSGDGSGRSRDRVSPIVTLDSSVQVTKCTGANRESNRHTVVVP